VCDQEISYARRL